MGVLTASDLKLIGEEMGRVVDDSLMPRIEELIDEKLAPIRAQMVTKDYLDEKLGNVNGKITVLTDILCKNGAISTEQRNAVRLA